MFLNLFVHQNEQGTTQIIWFQNTKHIFTYDNLGDIAQKEFKVSSDIIMPKLFYYHPSILCEQGYSVLITIDI